MATQDSVADTQLLPIVSGTRPEVTSMTKITEFGGVIDMVFMTVGSELLPSFVYVSRVQRQQATHRLLRARLFSCSLVKDF